MTVRVLRRRAGRVILLDPRDRVFLLQGTDVTLAPRPTWWFTPGGGVEPGESLAAAARREAFEELGLRLSDLTGPVHRRFSRFEFEGTPVEQQEEYFLARTGAFRLDDANWSETERRSVIGHAWWTVEELRHTGQTVYPAELADIVDRLTDERSVPSV